MIDTGIVEIRRLLPAPVDEVFRWWTEAELLERWMSPTGTVSAVVDFRVGGAFTIVMRDTGMEIEHRGKYVEIDPPRRLVFTWSSRFTGGPSLVTVTFEPAGVDQTRVVLVHSRLSEEAAPSHAGGWDGILTRLERELASR